MRVRRMSLLAVMSLALSIVSGGLNAPAARALTPDAATTLPVVSFTDLVLDEAHGHIFVSGSGNSEILVRDLTGAAVATIADTPGVRDLALSPDGATLYAALTSSHAIAAIDTSTLLATARYATGDGTCPESVAAVSGKLWFAYGCDRYQTDLGVVDPSTAPPTTTLRLLPSVTQSFVVLSAPAKPGMVLLAGVESSMLRVYDVSSGTALPGPSHEGHAGAGAAVSADGSWVVDLAGEVFLTSDLSAAGAYVMGSGTFATGFATGSGGVAAASMYPEGITVFRPDRSQVRTYSFSPCCDQSQSGIVPVNGLAFTADTATLYAMTGGYNKATMLRVLHDPLKSRSTLSLTKPASASINHAFAITGKLSSPVPIPAGQVITVVRDRGAGGAVTPVASTVTASGGTFTITDTVTQRGAYGYRATWQGDAQHSGSTVRITFAVMGLVPSLTITTGSGPYAYGARPLVVAHLSTTKLRSLKVYVQPYGGTKILWNSGTVDSHGNLSAYYTLTRRATFTAMFAGDETYEPRTYTKALLSHARVSSALQGSYGTSGSYRLYRTSVDPLLVITVAPNNSGTCVQFFAQRYYSGAWHNVATLTCNVYLDRTSRGGAVLITNAPSGARYRLRGLFIGNNRNVATTGAWQYLRFTT